MRKPSLLLLLLTACSGSDGGTPTGPGASDNPGIQPVASVAVTAPSASMASGTTQQLTATMKDAGGNTLSGRTVTWSSNNQAVVTVSGAGVATAVGAGSAIITANSEQRSGTMTLTVTAGAGTFTPLGIILTAQNVGISAGQPVADATAIQLPDGRVRLYFFAQGQGTRSAISTTAEGTSFVVEAGVRSTEEAWGQPRVIKLSDGRIRLYHLYADGIRSAISSDGLTFTPEPGTRISNASIGYEVGAPTIVPAAGVGYRMYFSDLERPGAPPGGHYIRSAVSADLLSWTVEPGIVLGVGATSGISGTVSHPFAVANSNGSVTLYYQGERQEGTGPNGSYRGIYRSTSTDGRTFTTEEKAGIPLGGDPDLITLANGTVLMYYGDHNSTLGGHLLVARMNR